MAKFGFGKRSQEDDGIPPEPGETDTDLTLPEEEQKGSQGRTRRLLILAGVVVVLAGGYYLADQLFFAPPPPPPVTRPAPPQPVAKAPAPATPAKAAAPPATPAPAPASVKEAAPAAAPVKAAPAPAAKVEAKAASPAARPAPEAPTVKAKAESPAPATSTAPVKPAAKPVHAAVPSSGGFSVQLGAMAVQANAENLKRKLDAAGFPATIRKGSMFMSRNLVTVGEPTGKREADELSRRLNVDGFPSQLLVVEGKYTPQVGAFHNLDDAIDLARELQKKNYPPKIMNSKPGTTMVYQVRHGQFDSRAAAVKRGEELKAKGFTPAMVVKN